MKLPREVPPASFSAVGLVCSSKTMAGRESRKYSSTYESSLYVGSVPKVLLDHRRSSNSKQSVGLSARLSSCDELPRPTDSSSRCSWLALHLPAQERLAGRGIMISKQPTQGAASKKACSPALERLAPDICVRAPAPVSQPVRLTSTYLVCCGGIIHDDHSSSAGRNAEPVKGSVAVEVVSLGCEAEARLRTGVMKW